MASIGPGSGGFFGSGSSQSATTTKTAATGGQQATSQQGPATATNITLADLNLGRSSASVNLNVQQTDFGAVLAGINAANEAQENAYYFAAGTIQEANELSELALKNAFMTVDKEILSLEQSRQDLLSFSAGAITQVTEKAQNAISSTIKDITDATKSESAQTFEKLIYLAGAALGVIGAIAYFSTR